MGCFESTNSCDLETDQGEDDLLIQNIRRRASAKEQLKVFREVIYRDMIVSYFGDREDLRFQQFAETILGQDINLFGVTNPPRFDYSKDKNVKHCYRMFMP